MHSSVDKDDGLCWTGMFVSFLLQGSSGTRTKMLIVISRRLFVGGGVSSRKRPRPGGGGSGEACLDSKQAQGTRLLGDRGQIPRGVGGRPTGRHETDDRAGRCAGVGERRGIGPGAPAAEPRSRLGQKSTSHGLGHLTSTDESCGDYERRVGRRKEAVETSLRGLERTRPPPEDSPMRFGSMAISLEPSLCFSSKDDENERTERGRVAVDKSATELEAAAAGVRGTKRGRGKRGEGRTVRRRERTRWDIGMPRWK